MVLCNGVQVLHVISSKSSPFVKLPFDSRLTPLYSCVRAIFSDISAAPTADIVHLCRCFCRIVIISDNLFRCCVSFLSRRTHGLESVAALGDVACSLSGYVISCAADTCRAELQCRDDVR
jgi:hypothetical protein